MKNNEMFPAMDFVDGADNVYRTDNYIVKQEVNVVGNDCGEALTFSQDTYYLRTEERDSYYRILFAERKDLEGRRVSVSTYIRKYVD